MELVTIAEFPSSVEATLAKNLLAENGIQAELADENVGDLFHLAANFGEVKLMVASDRAEEAKRLLESAHHHSGQKVIDEPEASS